MNHQKKIKLTFNLIVNFVCDYYNIPEKEIINPNRKKDIVRARQIIVYLVRKRLNKSYPVIGEKLGGRDHTTILYTYNKIKKEIENDKWLREDVENIMALMDNSKLKISFKIEKKDKNTKQKLESQKKNKNIFFDKISKSIVFRRKERVKMCFRDGKKYNKNQSIVIKSINDLPKFKIKPKLFIRQSSILQKYKKGWTLEEIGVKHRLTRQRIQQIVEKGLIYSLREILKQGIELDLKEFLKEEKRKHVIAVRKKHGILKKKIVIKEKRWSRCYNHCRECGTIVIKHHSYGYCRQCYPKTRIFKELQESSRLRHIEKRNKHIREHYIGGNREKAIIRDRKRCRECGLSREENYRKYDEDFRVIHVNDKKDHSLNNLLTLCRECFYKWPKKRKKKGGLGG